MKYLHYSFTVKMFSLSLVLFSGFMAARAQTISTIAGVGTVSGAATENVQATASHFTGPYGVVVDAAGNVYIADQTADVIRKVTVSTGIISLVAGTGVANTTFPPAEGVQATAAKFKTCTGVAVDAAGNIYIADESDNVVRKITASTGLISLFAGTGTSAGGSGANNIQATACALKGPISVALDPSGLDLYIADQQNAVVRKVVLSTGIISIVAGISGNGTAVTGDNGPATAATFGNPTGVAFDAAGNLYIDCEATASNVIRKVTIATGIITTVAGTAGTPGYTGDGGLATAAKLNAPNGVAVDAFGNIFIADYQNNVIREVNASSGIITTAAGSTVGFSGNGGPATAAQIHGPSGIAVDAAGNYYIPELGNFDIRKVTVGHITTSVALLPQFTNTSGCATSTSQTFTISGSNLSPAAGNITVTAPTGYLVSSSSTGTFATTATLAYTGSSMSAVPIYVEFAPATPGNTGGNITFSGGNVGAPPTVAVTGLGSGYLIEPAPVDTFGNVGVGITSASMIDTIKGVGIVTGGNITVTSPNTDFQVSLDGISFAASFSFPATTSLDTALYIQLTPSANAADTSQITVTGGDGACTTPVIVASGFGVLPCSAPAGPGALAYSGASATGVVINITPAGTSPDGYLVIQSATPFSGSPANGASYAVNAPIGANGTVIEKGTSLSVPVTALTGNTVYYYTIIAFNGGFTTPGACFSGPLYAVPLSSSVTTCSGAPGTLSAGNITSGGFSLTWAAPTGGTANPISYLVDVSTSSTFAPDIPGYPVATSSLSAAVNGLSSGTPYFTRVTAIGACNSVPTATVSATTLTGNYVPVPLTPSSFTSDVVADSSFNPTTTVTNPATNPGTGTGANSASYYFAGGYGFVASNYTFNAAYHAAIVNDGSLPASRVISSLQTPGVKYNLAPYTGNNALTLFPYTGFVTTGTMTFATPVLASNVYILATDGGPDTLSAITINFADGGPSQAGGSWNMPNWFTNSNPAFVGAGRITVANGVASINSSGANGPFLFQDAIAVSPANYGRSISSISFTPQTTTVAGYVISQIAVFAVSVQEGFLSTSVASLPPFSNTSACGASPVQSFTVSGNSFAPAVGNIVATAPAGFLVSSDNINFASTATLAYTGSVLSVTNVYVKLDSSVAGNVAGNITFSGGTLDNAPSVAVSGTSSGIYIAPTTTATFGNVAIGSSSTPTIDTIKGINITTGGNITVTSPNTDFKVSLDGVNFAASLSFPATATIDTALYIRLTPTASGPDTSHITVAGGSGACVPPVITASGLGTLPCVNPTILPTALTFSNTSGTGTGITFTPNDAPDGYLVLQGTSPFSGATNNGIVYAIGTPIGNANVQAIINNFPPATFPVALTPQINSPIVGNTTYDVTIIPFNGGAGGTCGGGPLYATGNLQNTYITCPAAPVFVSSTVFITSASIRWASSSGGGASPITYMVDVSTSNTFASDIAGYPVTGVADSVGGDITQTLSGLSSSTTYFYRITAIGSCNSTGTIGSITTVAPCAPVFTGGVVNGSKINSVHFAGIVFTGTGVSGVITDTATIMAGITYQDTIITAGFSGGITYIDFNGNGVYEPNEEIFGTYGGSATNTYTFPITAPTNVPTGYYKMRAIAGYGSNGVGPCGTYQYGDYNDFTVYIITPTLVTSVNSLPVFTADACTPSSIQSFTLTGNTLLPNSGGIVVTAPPGFLVSPTNLGNNSYVPSTTFFYNNGSIGTQTIYVKLSNTVAGNDTGSITFSGASVIANPSVHVSGIVNGLSVTSATENIGSATISVPSYGVKDTLSGMGLSVGTVTISSSNNDFQVSFDSSTWGNNIALNNGTSLDTPIYIRVTPGSTGADQTTISFTSLAGTACTPIITVNATGTNNVCAAPATPTGMSYSATSPTGTTVGIAPNGIADGYMVVQGVSPFTGLPANGTNYTLGGAVGNGIVVGTGTATSFTVTGLAGNTTYYYTVIAFNGGTNGSCGGGPLYSAPLSSTLTTCTATPGLLATSNVTSSGFTINWADPSSGGASALAYTIDVSTNNTFTLPVTGSPFTVSGTATSLAVTGLAVGATYFYRITSVTTPVAGTCTNTPTATGTVSTTAFTYFPIPIASGFNFDVIANGNAAPSVSTNVADGGPQGGFDGLNDVFISSDYAYVNSQGITEMPLNEGGIIYALPANGAFNSDYTPGLPFQLANYTGNNALVLNNPTGSGTLAFTTPVLADSIYVIGCVAVNTSANLPANANIIVTFTDNSTQTVASSFGDFYAGYSVAPNNNFAISVIGLANVVTGLGGGANYAPTLWQKAIGITTANMTKQIQSVTITSTSGVGYMAIFAASARAGTLNASTTSLPAFNGLCSGVESFTINGSSLFPTGGSIVAKAPAGFQVSTNGTAWDTTATYTYAVNTLASSTVFVRINPTVSAGPESGNITFTGGTANNPPSVAVSGTGSGIVVTSATKTFASQTINTTSASLNDTLSGAGLTAGTITLQSSNPDFQISLNGTTFSANPTITLTGTTLAATPIYLQFTPTTATLETTIISITGGGNPCTTTISASGTGISCVTGTWLGTTSNDWGTASNWSCSTIPNTSSVVTIAATAPNMPSINSGSYTVTSLALSSATTLNIAGGATLNVTGAVTDSGIISGAGVVVLNGATAQTYNGNGTISNLTLNNNLGASITSPGTMNITGALTITLGTFTGNNGIVLVSNAAGTARIAPITGTLNAGTVKVQQYIPGGRRGFRFLGHPFNAPIPLSQISDSVAITGAGGSASGFTSTPTNNPSAFWFNTATGDTTTIGNNPGWTAFGNTTATTGANSWLNKEGIRVLVRGEIGQGLDGNSYTPNPVTMNMTGTINTGAITETMALGTNSQYNLFSNPYPSPTDIGTVIQNAGAAISGSGFWVWDENQQTQGAYVTQPIANGVYVLPTNASFTVKAATATNLTFAESNKAATANAPLFKVTNMTNGVTLHLYDSSMHSWDIVYVSFNSNAADSMENYDAAHLHNSDLDFYSLSSNGRQLSIDARPYVTGQVVPLGIATDVQQTYIVKAEDFTVAAGEEVYLHDKYLNQYQQLQDGSQYTFSITADPASQGNNRFELSMAGDATTGVNNVNGSNGLKVSMVPNPATEQVTITYEAPRSERTSVRIMNMAGQEIVNMELGDEQQGSVVIPLHSVASGMYMVELISGSQTVTQRLVKQ